MNDEELEALLRDAARTYHRPPELADPEATWRAIERASGHATGHAAGHATADAEARPTLAVLRADDDAPRRGDARRLLRRAMPWLRMAAVLLVGVAIGRASMGPTGADIARAPRPTAGADAPRADAGAAPLVAVARSADEAAATEYLARIELLLAGLPAELEARRADPAYQRRADALLLQTRLLLDSPVAADPTLRSLLDDVEIVLAQVVRLDAARDPMDIDFLHQALEQRDVLPRLRDAVADHGAD